LVAGDEIKVTVTGLKNAAEIQRQLEFELEDWCQLRLPPEDEDPDFDFGEDDSGDDDSGDD
jgi:hypothetical protein